MSFTARDLPDAIQWHEGMMLAPQHFQQQSMRAEQVLSYHMMMATPFHWGVVTLLIDRVALVSGIFRVLELEAIMPDGLIVRHAPDRGDPLDLALSAVDGGASGAVLTIHAAVPAAKAGAGAAPGDLARYASAEGPLVADENSGEGEVRIPRLYPRLSLLVTSGPNQKPPQKYVTLPLAQVAYQNEAFTLTDFVPPTLRVVEQSPIGKLCADIARRCREKALFLMERAGAVSPTGGNQSMVHDTRSEIQGLVAALPPLEALLGSNVAHPFQVYLALTQLVGHMAAFAAGTAPPVLTRYDHNNCLIAFGEIRDYSMRQLDQVRETFVGLPFAYDNGKFVLQMEKRWLDRRLVIGVRSQVGTAESEVTAWVRNALIASRSKVEKLWEMRVMGAPRRPLETDDELDLIPTRGTVLFAIDNDAQFISPGELLEIWNADGNTRARPTEIILYVKSAS